MRLTIIEEKGDVQVWLSLVDNGLPPQCQNESFVIGLGRTRTTAIAAALVELDNARRDLEAARARDANTRRMPDFPPNRVIREGEL